MKQTKNLVSSGCSPRIPVCPSVTARLTSQDARASSEIVKWQQRLMVLEWKNQFEKGHRRTFFLNMRDRMQYG